MTNPRIALIQMVSSAEVANNLPRLETLVAEAAGHNVEAVFLPENFGALASADPRTIGEAEADSGGLIRRTISHLAAIHKVTIFAGTVPCATRPDGVPVPDARVRAASFVVDTRGNEIARYDKIHMFDVAVDDAHRHYLESATFEPGEEIVAVDTSIGKVGLSVCYDIRFPELYRRLFDLGAQVVAVPSAFTKVTGEAHFEVLMRARAIESFTFTVAACQGGTHDSGRQTYGHSMVVDPWGEIVCRAGEGEDILVAELDMYRQQKIRADMPIHQQRRLF